MNKIPVYFMPGLAASSLIFERITLPEAVFEIHLLEWQMPVGNEALSEYAKRIALRIKHENPVLVGVSFGGILVQEMALYCNPRKVIIISSVKSNLEFPKSIKIAKATKLYKLFPMSLLLSLEKLARFSFGKKFNHRMKLYEKFLSVRDIGYLNWAIEKVVLWDRTEVDKNVIHIHGDRDDVFPITNIKDCIVVRGGSHVMILMRYAWFNAHLPEIILERKNQ